MPPETLSSKVLTPVFTDLKGSTSLKAEKGDDVAGELIARHREHVKRLAATDGGRIIDWTGGGRFFQRFLKSGLTRRLILQRENSILEI